MLSRLIAYARGIARRGRIGAEVDDELAFHLQQEIDANIARGLSPAEARRVALRDLGGVTQTAEAVRDVAHDLARRRVARRAARHPIAPRHAGVHGRRARRADAEHRRVDGNLLRRRRRRFSAACRFTKRIAWWRSASSTSRPDPTGRLESSSRRRTFSTGAQQQTAFTELAAIGYAQHQSEGREPAGSRRRWRPRRSRPTSSRCLGPHRSSAGRSRPTTK